MKIQTIPKNKLEKVQFDYLVALLYGFCDVANLDTNFTLTIDFRTSRDNYETPGLFGGFLDLYKESRDGSFDVYVNVNAFREYTDPENMDNVAHCLFHELTHVKQMRERRLVIVSQNVVVWNGKIFDRAPFNYDVFSRVFNLDPALAQDYHTTALPWEREAYNLPESYMLKPLYSYQVGR